MMHSRLLVARSLLKEDGIIAVSIDDSELTNLTRLLDEVFGSESFIAKIIWKKRNGPPADKTIGTIHDYILLYARNHEKVTLHLKPRSQANIDGFKNPDKHPKGVWMSGDLTANVKGGRYVASLYYPITNPNTGEDHYPPNNGNWRFSRTTIEAMLQNNEIYFGADGKGRPARKRFLQEMKEGVSFSTVWDDVAYNADGGREIGAVMGNPNIFDNPKPLNLITELLSLTAVNGDTYLDFFGGSGTSMIAAIKQKGIRSIVVQIPEATEENSPARRDGFDKISGVTIERVKRVIQGYGITPQPLPDTGFKVYKLAKSNFPRCEFTPDPKLSDDENVAALKRYIAEKESASLLPLDDDAEQAVFDEVLLKCGFQLHYTRTRREDFMENTVYEVTDGKRSTLACLAWNEGIKDTTLKRLRELDETQEKPFFICLERSLTTTSKWNLDHLLGKRLTAF